MSGITFDAGGGLVALDRDDQRVLALAARAPGARSLHYRAGNRPAQAIRNPARQARLSRLIRQAGVEIAELNRREATAVGLLLARTAASDVADAHVLCAQRTGQAVVAGDLNDLQRIAPQLRLVTV